MFFLVDLSILYNSVLTCKIFSQDVVGGLGDVLLSHNLRGSMVFYGLEISSKEVVPHSIFCAIKGDRHDGHDFVDEAISMGAKCFLVDREDVFQKLSANADVCFVYVTNVVEAMGRMAAHRRRTTLEKCKVVAVTGSFGKTSVTQSLYLTLAKFCEVSAPIRSYNNKIGVPFTIMNASNSSSVLVLEMGTDSIGGISPLTKIGNPDIAIITGVYSAHLGCFGGDLRNTTLAKAEIFDGLKKDGVVILNEANTQFEELAKIAASKGIKNILRVGLKEKSHIYLTSVRLAPFFTLDCEAFIFNPKGSETVPFTVNSFGTEPALNFLFVIAVVKLFRFDIRVAAKVFPKIPIIVGRGNVEEAYLNNKKVTIVNSAYNSSPEALKMSIRALGEIKALDDRYGRSVCIIGDMKELGDEAGAIHDAVAQEILDNNIDFVCTVGELSKRIYDSLPEEKRGSHFDSSKSLGQNIKNLLRNNDIVLFKASHSVGLEEALDKLYK